MSKEVFRKKALDRLSSPEQLDMMIAVTPNHFWLVSIAALIVVVCVGVWSFFGVVQEKVTLTGVITKSETKLEITPNSTTMLLFSPLIQAQGLDPGMRISLRLGGSIKGHLAGTIVQIDSPITPYAELVSILKDESLVSYLTGNQPTAVVYCVMDKIDDRFPIGFITTADVIIKEKKPISYVFPNI